MWMKGLAYDHSTANGHEHATCIRSTCSVTFNACACFRLTEILFAYCDLLHNNH